MGVKNYKRQLASAALLLLLFAGVIFQIYVTNLGQDAPTGWARVQSLGLLIFIQQMLLLFIAPITVQFLMTGWRSLFTSSLILFSLYGMALEDATHANNDRLGAADFAATCILYGTIAGLAFKAWRLAVRPTIDNHWTGTQWLACKFLGGFLGLLYIGLLLFNYGIPGWLFLPVLRALA